MSNVVENEAQVQNFYGFGQALKDAREAKGVSFETVASELNILVRYLQALESENFEALPKFAFARGFVVNYARYLELDVQAVANDFDKAYPSNLKQDKAQDIKAPLKPMGTLNRDRNRVRINLKLVAACVGLLVLVILLLKVISSATKDDTNVNQSQDVLTLNEQAAGAAVGATGSAIGMANGTIELRSKGDVNVVVTDANGNVLLQGNQPRGNYNIQGATPIKVEIDNPAQADLSFNGKAVRLGEHIKDGRASLSLQ